LLIPNGGFVADEGFGRSIYFRPLGALGA
jgi:hypothetical protein